MRERGRKGTERRRKRKAKGGKERRCAVGIFNYFRLCDILISTTAAATDLDHHLMYSSYFHH